MLDFWRILYSLRYQHHMRLLGKPCFHLTKIPLNKTFDVRAILSNLTRGSLAKKKDNVFA